MSHLKRRHGDESVSEYKKYAQEKKLQKRAENANTTTRTCAALTPEERSELLVKFIINAMVPLRTVEDPYFRKLIGSQTIISRRTLSRRIEDWYTKSEESITEMCRTPQYICTTCDIWSGKKRSFFGVTAHWITENFERKSAALACRRFNNKHTGERIANLLTEIHVAYEIEDKIVATVTDNASNFRKAFSLYGVKRKNVDCCDSLIQHAALTNTSKRIFSIFRNYDTRMKTSRKEHTVVMDMLDVKFLLSSPSPVS